MCPFPSEKLIGVFFTSFVLFVACLQEVRSFCWEPGSNPFTGPPKTTRLPEGDEIQVDWMTSFHGQSDEECDNVDFMVMIHPRNKPSAYKISDFVQKGQRSTNLYVDKGQDYVLQVIARENKGATHGIDYKFSDMTNDYASGRSGTAAESKQRQQARPTTERPAGHTTTLRQDSLYHSIQSTTAKSFVQTSDQNIFEKLGSVGLDPNPWYIYECIPFLKEIPGFEDKSDDKSNDILVDFIRQMNKKPIDIVEEFLLKSKAVPKEEFCSNDDTALIQERRKGYIVKCDDHTSEICCPSPWSTISGCDTTTSVCFKDFKSCDGGRCIHEGWIGDGWPDCLDGSDEITAGTDFYSNLPRQLVCVQCAGVVLSAGFLCRESSHGLTLNCVNDVMGYDGACNDCITQYLNIR